MSQLIRNCGTHLYTSIDCRTFPINVYKYSARNYLIVVIAMQILHLLKFIRNCQKDFRVQSFIVLDANVYNKLYLFIGALKHPKYSIGVRQRVFGMQYQPFTISLILSLVQSHPFRYSVVCELYFLTKK